MVTTVFRSNRVQVERQIAFGTARGLTRTAKLAADDVTRRLPVTFDRPTPFTMRSIGTEAARKDSLVARVLVKDQQAKYLLLEETGGSRTPQPGAPVNIPAQAKLNSYGNLPRRAIKTYKATKNVFFADGSGKTSHLKPGVYQRAKVGKRRAGGTRAKDGLKMLVGFKPIATYSRRFGFRKSVEAIARAAVGRAIAESVRQAFATAR